MTREEAAERMRLAVASGVIDMDDVVLELYKRGQYKPDAQGFDRVSGEFIVDILNKLLGENNVATSPF